MKRILLASICAVIISLVLYGCGKAGEPKESGNPPVIRIAGSTSMMPISEKLARAYEKKHPNVRIHVEGGDSTLGIKGAARGIVEIGSVSRPLTSEESKALTAYTISEDSISIIVNAKNPVHGLTINEVKEVFSGKITNWSQFGGLNGPVTVIRREHGSGTCSVFEDVVMGKETAVDEKALVMTSNGSVLSSVTRDINAIGYISSNYRAEGVKPLEIHTGENKVFILSRPLLYVVPAGAGGLTRDFLDFCTGAEGKEIVSSHKDS